MTDHDLYIGTDGRQEFLLTIWEDGTHQIATRSASDRTWSPPAWLTRQSSEVSG